MVARAAGGMPEVGGDAVLWLPTSSDELDVVAELLALAAGDRELRDELARRGRERLNEFAPEQVRGSILDFVERAA